MLLHDIKEIKDGRYVMKDTEINITINQASVPEIKVQPEGVIVEPIQEGIPAPKEDVIYSDDIEYKGYVLKQIPATGEIDIFATGGALIIHTENYETAKQYIDNIS